MVWQCRKHLHKFRLWQTVVCEITQQSKCTVCAPKFAQITPILKSLHWLKVSERIKCKIGLSLSHTYKILNTTQPASYLFSLLMVTHTLFTLRHSDQTVLITQVKSLLPTCFTSSLEPASIRHSEFLIQIFHPPLNDLYLNMPVGLSIAYTLLWISLFFQKQHRETNTGWVSRV